MNMLGNFNLNTLICFPRSVLEICINLHENLDNTGNSRPMFLVRSPNITSYVSHVSANVRVIPIIPNWLELGFPKQYLKQYS